MTFFGRSLFAAGLFSGVLCAFSILSFIAIDHDDMDLFFLPLFFVLLLIFF